LFVTVAIIEGRTTQVCEAAYMEYFGDNSDYGATYSPAYGHQGGLIQNVAATRIDANDL